MPRVSIVVPVFMNADRLAELAERVAAVLDVTYEILFVDDASPDNARDVIRVLAEQDPRLGALTLAENVGQNTAVLAGLAHARGEVVVVMDGDLQDPPEALPVLICELDRSSADVVFATRRGRYESFARLFTSRLLKWALWLLTAGRVPVDAGLFVAVERTVAERACAAAGPNPYVVTLLARVARRVEAVPVVRAPSSSSAYTRSMRLRVALSALASTLRPVSGEPRYRVAERIGRPFTAEPA